MAFVGEEEKPSKSLRFANLVDEGDGIDPTQRIEQGLQLGVQSAESTPVTTDTSSTKKKLPVGKKPVKGRKAMFKSAPELFVGVTTDGSPASPHPQRRPVRPRKEDNGPAMPNLSKEEALKAEEEVPEPGFVHAAERLA